MNDSDIGRQRRRDTNLVVDCNQFSSIYDVKKILVLQMNSLLVFHTESSADSGPQKRKLIGDMESYSLLHVPTSGKHLERKSNTAWIVLRKWYKNMIDWTADVAFPGEEPARGRRYHPWRHRCWWCGRACEFRSHEPKNTPGRWNWGEPPALSPATTRSSTLATLPTRPRWMTRL